MNYTDPQRRRSLAEAYVLGTLRGRARQRFQRLLRDDARLRRDVDALSSRWDLLVERLPPTEPGFELWPQIERRIDPRAGERQDSWLWIDFRFWRGWALAATLATVALGMTLLNVAQQPVLVVVVSDDAESRAGWVISGKAGADTLIVKNLRPQPLPADRDFQLWVKLPDQSAVRPVGLISASGDAVLRLPEELSEKLPSAEKFGVSIEPAGGSPTGQPTTTPLYHGPAPLRL